MHSYIRTALGILEERGISHDPNSVRRHGTQGLMSEVFMVNASVGELVIHVVNLTPTLKHFRPWEKLKPVSKLLLRVADVPAAEVFVCERFFDSYIVVQRRLPGRNLGNIILDDEVRFTWHEPFEQYEEQVERIVADIHGKIPIDGFGLFIPTVGGIRGEYLTWKEFLAGDSVFWLDGILAAEHSIGNPTTELDQLMRSFLAHALPRVSYTGKASLVSCDIVNPSNILVENGRVTGVIDWEWCLAADPAWEFAYTNPFRLHHYFARFATLGGDDAQRDFRTRSSFYLPFLYLMWAYGTSGKPRSSLYTACRERMKKAMTARLKNS